MPAKKIIKRDQEIDMEDVFNKVSALFEIYSRVLEDEKDRPMNTSAQVGLINLYSDTLRELEILVYNRETWKEEE